MSYTMQAKNGYKWWWVFNYLLSFLLLLLYLFLELLTFLCLENDKTFWQPMQTSFLSISFRFLLSCLVNYKKKQGDTKNNNFICAFFQLYRHELMKSVKGPFTNYVDTILRYIFDHLPIPFFGKSNYISLWGHP